MATVTAPIMTDATGQSIDSKLNSLLVKMDNLAAAFQPNASGIVYSNTTSGLTGDDVQEAIDEMAADVSEIKQSLSDLASELVSVTLSYNSSSSGFIIPNDVLTPSTEQICCPSRNIQTGAIYICWYDKSIRGFRVGTTASGNAPTNGQKCSFEYFA